MWPAACLNSDVYSPQAWQKDTLLLRNVVATSPDLPQKIHTDHVWLKALLVLLQVCYYAMPNSASEP